MDEQRLFEYLKTFTPPQFVDLRRTVGLPKAYLSPGADPTTLADLFIDFVKQRYDGDLSVLIQATDDISRGLVPDHPRHLQPRQETELDPAELVAIVTLILHGPSARLANRDDEINLFIDVLSRNNRKNMIMFSAGGQMGKTTLTRAFVEICNSVDLPVANVELAHQGMAQVIDQLHGALRVCSKRGCRT
jgi:hypothetical protein